MGHTNSLIPSYGMKERPAMDLGERNRKALCLHAMLMVEVALVASMGQTIYSIQVKQKEARPGACLLVFTSAVS